LARISGATPSGCASAPPLKKGEKHTFGKPERLLLGGKLRQDSLVCLQKPVVDANPESIQILKEEQVNTRQDYLKIRPNCYAVGPNLGGYTQWVRWRAPTKRLRRKARRKLTRTERSSSRARSVSA
jgi:hypothetical protein